MVLVALLMAVLVLCKYASKVQTCQFMATFKFKKLYPRTCCNSFHAPCVHVCRKQSSWHLLNKNQPHKNQPQHVSRIRNWIDGSVDHLCNPGDPWPLLCNGCFGHLDSEGGTALCGPEGGWTRSPDFFWKKPGGEEIYWKSRSCTDGGKPKLIAYSHWVLNEVINKKNWLEDTSFLKQFCSLPCCIRSAGAANTHWWVHRRGQMGKKNRILMLTNFIAGLHSNM